MNTQGWIKLQRVLLEWEWSDEPNMTQVWIHLLLHAAYEDTEWQGSTIERGQCVIKLRTFAAECGITEMQLRTCLSRLQKCGQINKQITNKYTIVSICKFDIYQSNICEQNQEDNKQTTSKQQANNNQITGKQQANNTHKEEINKLIIQEEKNIVTTDAGAHTCDADFSEIENTETANFRLICLERGWQEDDYLNAVRVFRATCEADGKSHESPADLANHFRAWCNHHYRYGEKPLKSESEKPATVQKNCFDEIFAEFYAEKYGTDFIFRPADQKAIASMMEKIVLKMQEQNAEINLAEKQNALRAFIRKSYEKADKWLKDNFSPIILDSKFNEIYGKLKSNTATGANSRSYVERIASELTGI